MERQLRLHRADLLAVAERCDCYGAIYIAELRRFEQRKRRNALASGKLESICDQRVILILADFHFVSVRFAVVDELSFHVGCPDKCVKMSRSSNSQKIVLDDMALPTTSRAAVGIIIIRELRYYWTVNRLLFTLMKKMEYVLLFQGMATIKFQKLKKYLKQMHNHSC